MKINLVVAFIIAAIIHLVLIAILVVNVSLDKPKRPNELSGKIMHATMVSLPPKGNPKATSNNIKPPKTEQKIDIQKQDELKAKQKELEAKVAKQKALEQKRQEALALKKKQELERVKLEQEKKKLEEQKKFEEKKKLEEKKKAEEKKKLEEKKKAEAKKKALEQEMAKKRELEKKKAQEIANSIEDDLFGSENGVDGAELSGNGGVSGEYGAKVVQLIEQNWRIDPSMNGKKVIVTVNVGPDGMISNEKCDGDKAVCNSALSTLRLIGMLPMPPKNCQDCNTIVISMTPKL